MFYGVHTVKRQPNLIVVLDIWLQRSCTFLSFYPLSKIIGIDVWRLLVLNNMYLLRQHGAQKFLITSNIAPLQTDTCLRHERSSVTHGKVRRLFRAYFFPYSFFILKETTLFFFSCVALTMKHFLSFVRRLFCFLCAVEKIISDMLSTERNLLTPAKCECLSFRPRRQISFHRTCTKRLVNLDVVLFQSNRLNVKALIRTHLGHLLSAAL